MGGPARLHLWWAAAPCPACNKSPSDEPPRLPKGFNPDDE
jgi:hypothetical protein